MCFASFLLSSLLLLSCSRSQVGDGSPNQVRPNVAAGWMELPEMQDGLVFVSHPMEVDGKVLRN